LKNILERLAERDSDRHSIRYGGHYPLNLLGGIFRVEWGLFS